MIHKPIRVVSAVCIGTFAKTESIVETYEVEVYIRGKYFRVGFQLEKAWGRVMNYSCFKAKLELYGVMIAYHTRELTKEQDRNKKHNQATALISKEIATYLGITEGVNLYEQLIE